ncbi:cationic amino acid transporter 1-like protein [Tanacetum coccineum]
MADTENTIDVSSNNDNTNETNNNSNSNDKNDSGNNTSSGNGNENDNNNGNSGNGNDHANVNSDNNNVNRAGDGGGSVNNNNNLSTGSGQDNTNVDNDPKINSSVCLTSDFFPEESFKSWSNYSKALMETKARLKERLLARSSDDFEINGMRARSQNEMKRSLNWFDLIWFGVGAVMGCAALLSVICYTEFAVELPVAGGSFAYLRVELGDFVAFIAAGATKANPANFDPFAPFGIRGILKASSVIFFAYVGFDGVATLGERTKKPEEKYQLDTWILDVNSYHYLLTLGYESRYFTHIARTHMAPPILAVVHKKLGTPVNAAIIMTAANCLVAFFTSLDVLASLLSISTLFIFSLVAIGLLVRRYYSTGMTSDRDRNKLIMFLMLIVCSSTGISLLWARGVNSWLVYAIVAGIWFLSTLGIRLQVNQARNPRLWGAPLVPWLPSCSIALNLFMMGSIDGASFLRFMGWTAVLLTYYFLVGLHASYDASKETIKMEDDNEVERDRVSTTSEALELNTITTSRT